MTELTEREFSLIRDFLKKNYGISLGNEKRSLVFSRLRSDLLQHGFSDFTQYYDYLVNDKSGAALTSFVNKMTTNHTYFMREADHFGVLKEEVLPYIEQKHSASKDLRLWCASSSSGEEPYTLQMIIQDYFASKPGWNTEILATDISTKVLTKAVAGVYTNESLNPLPSEWKTRYLRNFDSEHFVMSEELKKLITFRQLNLMDKVFPFKKPFQAIFARNVMIYFDNDTRKELVRKFYDVTEPGGYLFVGHSESLNQLESDYKYQQPAVYRKV